MRFYEKQDDGGGRCPRKAGVAKWYRAKKHRVERRRAKRDPECAPAYNRYRGWVMLLPILFLAACNVHDPVRLVGKDNTEINLGRSVNFASQSYVSSGFDARGNPRITIRDNSEAVPSRALDVAGVAYGTHVWGAVEKAADAGATAISLGAQKQATKQAGINAALEAERIKAGVETTRILNPVTP